MIYGDTVADLKGVFVAGVRGGKFTLLNPIWPFDGVGDGFLALNGALVNISSAHVEGAARAGLLYDNASGIVADVVSTKNRFGLVLQGAKKPTLLSGNLFDGNSENSTINDGDLPVPDALSVIP